LSLYYYRNTELIGSSLNLHPWYCHFIKKFLRLCSKISQPSYFVVVCICTKDISFPYFVCQSNWCRSGSFDNFGILILCLDLWNLISYIHEYLVPVATPSMAWVCGFWLAEIAVLNPTQCMDVFLLWVSSVSGLWHELISCPGESYRVWCVDVCDLQNIKKWGGHGPRWAARPQKCPPVKAILIIVCNPFYPFCICLSFNVSRDGMNSVLKFLCSLLI